MIPALNLLPPTERKELDYTKLLQFCFEIIGLLFILMALGGIILYTARVLLEIKFQQVAIEGTPGSQKIAALNHKIRAFNFEISEFNQLLPEAHPVLPLLTELIKATPEDLRWTTFILNGRTSATLQGQAATRETLRQFQENLIANPLRPAIRLPLQFLIPERDLNFSIEINLPETLPL